jgi:hypothetical protein
LVALFLRSLICNNARDSIWVDQSETTWKDGFRLSPLPSTYALIKMIYRKEI